MPNLLALEKSPYLLQHKDNPVDWRPWGEEAFRAARERNVPLILSIGYSTCHWCHVMERECFEDAEIAAAMNRDFVCVKLDREERPDVDKLYMTAVQAMTGQGGWPLNVFLTPGLKPFFGGTYFPPAPAWGRPSWPQLLERVAGLWRERRGEVEADAERLAAGVASFVAARPKPFRAKPGAEVLARAEKAFEAAYDPVNAGFGGAPKFPLPANQRFLLRRGARPGGERARELAVSTLRAIARGGIRDQIGGGFHRYSTDAEWRIPHFEKMLYDNAQLIENLADALRAGPDAELARALREAAAYLARDLRGAHGGFYSAEDADSLPAGAPDGGEKEEGAFYEWRRAELDAVLGAYAAAFAARYVIGEGPSVPRDAEPSALPEAKAAPARAALLAARAARPRPALDDKVLCSWNGLALSGLARAHQATGDPGLLALAEDAADFLRRELASPDGRTLAHSWRGGRGTAGLADDYAFLAQGLLDLYEAGFRPERLAWALDLAEEAVRRFAAPEGGLWQSEEGGAPELFARAVEDADGVEPSASAVLAEAALRLDALLGRPKLQAFAEKTLSRFAAQAAERPLSAAYLLCALDRALAEPRAVLIAGLDLPGGAELLAAARSLGPDVGVAGFAEASRAELAKLLPAVAAMPKSARARAYVCAGGACGTPVEDAAGLGARLGGR